MSCQLRLFTLRYKSKSKLIPKPIPQKYLLAAHRTCFKKDIQITIINIVMAFAIVHKLRNGLNVVLLSQSAVALFTAALTLYLILKKPDLYCEYRSRLTLCLRAMRYLFFIPRIWTAEQHLFKRRFAVSASLQHLALNISVLAYGTFGYRLPLYHTLPSAFLGIIIMGVTSYKRCVTEFKVP